MPSVTIRIPTPLRTYTGGRDEAKVDAGTVGEALHGIGVDAQRRRYGAWLEEINAEVSTAIRSPD